MKVKRLNKSQKGFTLVELLITLPIIAIVIAVAGGAIIQVIQSTRISAHMTALRQVQTTGYWVSKDSLQAQNVTPTGPSGFPLNLKWTDWEGNSHDITYTLETMSGELHLLQRSEGTTTTTMVGQYLTDSTTCSWNEGILTLTVEASVAGAQGPQTETRTYEIEPRPDPVS